MLELTLQGLADRAGWAAADVQLPSYDVAAMRARTCNAPRWVHFGAGNIFRAYLAQLADAMLESGESDTGVIAAETFDQDILRSVYVPHDNLVLRVTLLHTGTTQREVLGSIAAAYSSAQDSAALQAVFENPTLQMASFTITEKGYALRDMGGALLPVVAEDMASGPDSARHAMAVATALLLRRYLAGGTPMAMVSMDNCSHNGDLLRAAVLEFAHAWEQHGHAKAGFAAWAEGNIGFPCSMIDKIVPRPDATVCEQLTQAGIVGLAPLHTQGGTFIAPFVNCEAPQYLVVEDAFPNGRPPLTKAGVYVTDRATVDAAERMKVTTCLNPLHTALAVLGCLLGYTKIADEMQDADLAALARRIGIDEGMPVVTNPHIFDPADFLREVLEVRLPNPFLPDAPQRIATDTSRKLAIRFGETIKAYAHRGHSLAALRGISLAIAAWFRYLLGVDDELRPMEVSADPMLEELQQGLMGVSVGDPATYSGQLLPFLRNTTLFGVDLVAVGLAPTIEAQFVAMLGGRGAVRAALQRALTNP